MTADEKRVFVTDLCTNIMNDVLGRIDAMPAEWDGHELREYLAIRFQRERGALLCDGRSRRARDFHNEVLINGAL